MQTDEYLMHWGILGMKWGRRRFQNQDGTLTSEGKIRYGSGTSPAKGQNGSKKSKKAQAKVEKSKAQKMQEGRKRAAEERAKKKEYEEAKERAIAKGKASDVMKFQGDLTHEQMQRVLTRLQDEENLAKYVAKEKPTIRKKIEAASETMGAMGKSIDNAVSFGRSVHNAIKFAKQMSGNDEDSQNKRIQKIADHGTAEEVSKNAYKLNSKQMKAAQERLANIEKVNQQRERERKKADKEAEEKVKQKDAQNRAKAAAEKAAKIAEKKASDDKGAIGIKGEKWITGQEKYLADYNFKRDVASNKNNMTYEERERLRRAKISGVSKSGSSFKVRRTRIN
jgi:hypothetical protein